MNIKRKLNQFAVYWGPVEIDNENAETTYADPIEVPCRWEDSVQILLDDRGEKWTTKSAVDLLIPVVTLGVLWKGRLADTVGTGPMENAGASAIRAVESIPSRKATQTLYTAFL